jgi:hypothetical protein
MESSTERFAGTIAGVHGSHVFIKWRDCTFYAHRRELDFPDPHLGLPVSFLLGKQPRVALPCALKVRKA